MAWVNPPKQIGSTKDDNVGRLNRYYRRVLAAGFDSVDLDNLAALLNDGLSWLETWDKVGDSYAALADEAVLNHHELAAGDYFVRASLAFHFADLEAPPGGPTRTRARVAYHTRALPYLQPPGDRLLISLGVGELRGVLRLPSSDGPWSAVIMLPDLDSSKEEMIGIERQMLLRGLATLSVDGPGQGEDLGRAWCPSDHSPLLVAIDVLSRREDLLPSRIGLLGIGLGGLPALLAAASDSRVRCCATLATPFPLPKWQKLPAVQKLALGRAGYSSAAFRQAELKDGDFKLALQRLRCAFLAVHGERDPIHDADCAERLVEAASNSVDRRLVLVPDGDFRCENRPRYCRQVLADWLREQLLH